MKTDVSFITINYNSTKYTLELVKTIKEFTLEISYEIIIVDNASEEKEQKILYDSLGNDKNIKIVQNRINGGFAAGNMLGVNYAKGKYYFFINNDTKLLNNTALILKNHLDAHPNTALCTATIEDDKSNFSSSYKLFPSVSKELFGNSFARKISKHNFPSNKTKLKKATEVEVVSGSCMFFRASSFCELGGFDTAFFLYCEEEDISKRVWLKGESVAFVPDAKIYHASGKSASQNLQMKKEFYISYKHLIYKHFGIFKSSVLMFLLFLKLLRRSLKTAHGYKLLLFFLKGLSKKESLRYQQKVIIES